MKWRMDAKQFISWLLQAAVCAVGVLLMSTINNLAATVEALREQVAVLRSERLADKVQIEINTRNIEKLDVRVHALETRGR